jgi:hypothetical protein
MIMNPAATRGSTSRWKEMPPVAGHAVHREHRADERRDREGPPHVLGQLVEIRLSDLRPGETTVQIGVGVLREIAEDEERRDRDHDYEEELEEGADHHPVERADQDDASAGRVGLERPNRPPSPSPPPPRVLPPARPICRSITIAATRKIALLIHMVTAGLATRRSARLSPRISPTQ